MLTRIANREDPDQTSSSDKFYLGLSCLPILFGKQLVFKIFRTSTIVFCLYSHWPQFSPLKYIFSTSFIKQGRSLWSKHIGNKIQPYLKNSNTGCVNCWYLSNLFSTVSGLSSSRCINRSPVTSSIPLKINRGSFMSAHVLSNLLNELEKRD